MALVITKTLERLSVAKFAANVQGLLSVGEFEKLLPITKARKSPVVEVMQKADSNSSAGTAADSEQKVDNTSVSNHSSKPHVVGSQSNGTLIESFTHEIHSVEKFPLPPQSSYSKIDASEIDINKEIDRWTSVLSANEAELEKKSGDELVTAFIKLAKQNLEYLLSLSHPIVAN